MTENPEIQWFVMRDLKRSNANVRAYQALADLGFEVFTPMADTVVSVAGRKKRIYRAVIPDLLFVHSDRSKLDPVVAKTDTLQYRYMKGADFCQPMTVRESEMNRFIALVGGLESPQYYLPEEVKPEMIGRRVRIIGGQLDGIEANLLSLRGTRKKRLLVSLPGIIAASVVITPECIELLPKS